MSPTGQELKTKLRRKIRLRWILLGLLVLLVAARVALPFVLEAFVNRTLDSIDGYQGQVDDVDLALWRGAYWIEEVQVEKVEGDIPVPFFSVALVELSIAWRPLVRGALVGQIRFLEPKLQFVAGPTEAETQTGFGRNWVQPVQDLFPFRFDQVEISDGEIHYRDFHSDPKIDVELRHVEALATNLSNSRDLTETLIASLEGSAEAAGGAPLTLGARFDPYNEDPTFELDLELEALELRRLDDLLRAYANVDAEAGTFALYLELAAAEGTFEGYAKPFFKDIEVLEWRQEEEGFLHRLWEGVVDGLAHLVENPSEDQVASRIPLRGTLDDPKAGLWRSIVTLLRNGFFQALRTGLEGSVDFEGLRNDGDASRDDVPED